MRSRLAQKVAARSQMRKVIAHLERTAGWWAINSGERDDIEMYNGDGPADMMGDVLDDIDQAYRQAIGRAAYPEELQAVFEFVFGPIKKGWSWPKNEWIDEAIEILGVPMESFMALPKKDRDELAQAHRDYRNKAKCGDQNPTALGEVQDDPCSRELYQSFVDKLKAAWKFAQEDAERMLKRADASDGKKTGDRTGVGFFIPLPSDLAEQFPPLGDEDKSDPHATFLYVGNVPQDQEEAFLKASQDAFAEIREPVRAHLQGPEYFVHPDKGRRVALMGLRYSHDMAGIRWKLRDKLIDAGIQVDDRFPLIYQPHVTLAYLEGLTAVFGGTVPKGDWEFDGIEVWGLPKLHTIPFGAATANKVATAHLAGMTDKASRALMKFLADATKRLGVAKDTYVVGGAVRNFVIDQPIKDIDIVIDSIAAGRDSEWLAKKLQGIIPVPTNLTTNNYGVAILTIKGNWEVGGADLKGEVIEIANARKESYGGEAGKGYKPHMVEPSTIEEDVRRREFNFNTLMWRLLDLAQGPDKAEIIDLTGCGLRDLQEGVARCPQNPDKVFSDDPSRMVRAIKFLLKYGLKIAPDVEASIKKNRAKLKNIPSGHLSNMIIGTFYEGGVGKKALLEMKRLGLLDVVKEIAQTDKPFALALGNWADKKADLAFLFDLMDLGMPAGKRLNFLDSRQRQRVREITVQMTADESDAFVDVLAKPGKVIDTQALAAEFGLTGKGFQKITEAARVALLADPVLASNGRRLYERVRQMLSKGGRVAALADKKKQLEVLQTLLEKAQAKGDAWLEKFLPSTIEQLKKKKVLSDKQYSAIRRGLYQNGMKPLADLFRPDPSEEAPAPKEEPKPKPKINVDALFKEIPKIPSIEARIWINKKGEAEIGEHTFRHTSGRRQTIDFDSMNVANGMGGWAVSKEDANPEGLNYAVELAKRIGKKEVENQENGLQAFKRKLKWPLQGLEYKIIPYKITLPDRPGTVQAYASLRKGVSATEYGRDREQYPSPLMYARPHEITRDLDRYDMYEASLQKVKKLLKRGGWPALGIDLKVEPGDPFLLSKVVFQGERAKGILEEFTKDNRQLDVYIPWPGNAPLVKDISVKEGHFSNFYAGWKALLSYLDVLEKKAPRTAATFNLNVGDSVLYGKYKNKKGTEAARVALLTDPVLASNGRRFYERVRQAISKGGRTAKEFPTEDALKEYLKEHPDADESKHTVVDTENTDTSEEPEITETFETEEELNEFLKKREVSKKDKNDLDSQGRRMDGEKDFDGSDEWTSEHTVKTPGGSLMLGTTHWDFEEDEEGDERTFIEDRIIPEVVGLAKEALKAGKKVVFLAEGGTPPLPGSEQERISKALDADTDGGVEQDTWDDPDVVSYNNWSEERGDYVDPDSPMVKKLTKTFGDADEVVAALYAFDAGQGTELDLTPDIKKKLEGWGIDPDNPRSMYLAAFPEDAENEEDKKLLAAHKDNPINDIGQANNDVRQENLLQKIKDIEAEGGVAIVTPGASHAYQLKPILEKASKGKKSALRVAARYISAVTFNLNVGDSVLYGKYKNKKGKIKSFKTDEKGDIVVTIEPWPPSRKGDKDLKLFKIRPAPEPWPDPEGKQATDKEAVLTDPAALDKSYADLQKVWGILNKIVNDFPPEAFENRYVKRQLKNPWSWFIKYGQDVSQGVLDLKHIPPKQHKALELAARHFMSVRRMPVKFLPWLDKTRKYVEFLVMTQRWPDKDEGGDEKFKLGPFVVHNTMGLTGKKLENIQKALRKAAKLIRASSTPPSFKKVLYGDVLIVPQLRGQNVMAWYDRSRDDLAVRPFARFNFDVVHSIIHEFAHRWWIKFADKSHQSDWVGHHRLIDTQTPEIEMPDKGDELPLRVKGHKGPIYIDSKDPNGIYSFTVSIKGEEKHLQVPSSAIYKSLIKVTKLLKSFPTPYASTDPQEHFCEATAMRVMGKLPGNHLEPYDRIWGGGGGKTANTKTVYTELTLDDDKGKEIGTWMIPETSVPLLIGDAPLVENVVERFASRLRVAAKYQKKKEVPKADGKGTTTVYEYSEGQVQHRNREKAKRVEKLRGKLHTLQAKVKKDLKSKDLKTRLTALAVGLINDTYERVGNPDSAKDGHFGVTGWQAKHVTIGDGKATIKYIGKSGVSQEKETTDPDIVKVLKEAVKDKSGTDSVFEMDDVTVDSTVVNDYLKSMDITAKDIRGLHANRLMQQNLKAERKGTLPDDKKDREKKLKAEFDKALEATADAVGHEPATLKSQYLVPGLEDTYVSTGQVKENLAKQAGWAEALGVIDNYTQEFEVLFNPPSHPKPSAIDERLIKLYIRRGETIPQLLRRPDYKHSKLTCIICGSLHQCRCPQKVHDQYPDRISAESVCYNCIEAAGLGDKLQEQLPPMPRMASLGKQAIIGINNATDGDEGEIELRGFNGLISSLTLYERAIVQDMNIHSVLILNDGVEYTLRGHKVDPDAVSELVGAGYLEHDGDVVRLSDMFEVKQRLYTASRVAGMSRIQYHATSWDRVPSILKGGLRPPRGKSDVSTFAHDIPSISTADNPKDAQAYHPHGALLEIQVKPGAKYLKRSARAMRKGESLLDAVNRWSREVQAKGADGFYMDGWQSTVGNQTYNPAVLKIVRVVNLDEAPQNLKLATKTHAEKEDEEAQKLVKPAPKFKPPRKDLKKERMDLGDEDTEGGTADNDKDMSLNYKRVAARWLSRQAGKVPVDAEDKKPGDYWQKENGKWGVHLPGGNYTDADDEEHAAALAAGKTKPGEEDEGGDQGNAQDEKTEDKNKLTEEERLQAIQDAEKKKGEKLTPEEESEAEKAAYDQKVENAETEKAEAEAKKKKVELAAVTKKIKDIATEIGDPSIIREFKALEEDEQKVFLEAFQEEIDSLKEGGVFSGDVLSQEVMDAATEALDSDAFGFGMEPAASGKVMAAKTIAMRVAVNPTVIGGTEVNSNEKTEAKLKERSQQAFDQYTKMTPELRGASQKQMMLLLKKEKDPNKRLELQHIANGLALASVINDEKVSPLRAEPAEGMKALVKNLHKKGEATKLLGMSTDDFYGPAGREIVADAMNSMTQDELFSSMGGENGPYGKVIKGLQNNDYSEAQADILKGLIKGLYLDSMTSIHSFLVSTAKANGKKGEAADSGAKEAMEVVQSAENTEKSMNDAINACMEGSDGGPEALEKCQESVRKTRLKNLGIAVEVAKDTLGEPDPTDVATRPMLDAVEEKNLDNLEKTYKKEGKEGQSSPSGPKISQSSVYMGNLIYKGQCAHTVFPRMETRRRNQTMAKKLTKKGAQAVTADLDRLANLFEHDYEILGVEQRIAQDMAYRCDMLSDHLEKVALTGDDVVKEQGFDPDDIGRETSGPLENEPDEPYMKGEFDQQENRELREKVQDGELGPDRTTTEPQKPRPGVQAAFGDLTMALGTGGIPKEAAAQIEKALNLAATVVRQAKKELPPEFLENIQKKKDEAKDKGDDKGDDKKDDDKKDEKEGGKKKTANHGYDLTAE